MEIAAEAETTYWPMVVPHSHHSVNSDGIHWHYYFWLHMLLYLLYFCIVLTIGSTYRGLWGLVVVRLSWLSGGSSQRCPGFDSWQLPAFSLSSIFASQHLKSKDLCQANTTFGDAFYKADLYLKKTLWFQNIVIWWWSSVYSKVAQIICSQISDNNNVVKLYTNNSMDKLV